MCTLYTTTTLSKISQCWSLGSCPKKNIYLKNMYPRRVWLYIYGKQKGYPIHIGMPFVIQKIIRAFCLYLHVFAIMVGGVNFANFGTASTTEKVMWTKPAPRKGSKYVFLLFKYSLKTYTVHVGRITIFFGRLTDRQTDRQTKPIA